MIYRNHHIYDLWFIIHNLSNGEVDEEVDAAVDGQAEVTHTKQPAGKKKYSKYQIPNTNFDSHQAASWKVGISEIPNSKRALKISNTK